MTDTKLMWQDSRAIEVAHRWISSWNDQDLDAVAALLAAEVVFRSRNIAPVLGTDQTELHGRDVVMDYFRRALQRLGRSPGFELQSVLVGGDGVAVQYLGHSGREACEVFTLGDDGLIVAGTAYYR